MILEVADFRTADPADFEQGMDEMKGVIGSAAGYLGHTVERSIETVGRYLLIVRWESLDAHQGFRDSEAFQTWKGTARPAS